MGRPAMKHRHEHPIPIMTKKLESTLVGVAGEYLVAGELTLRGHIASITLRNSRGMDIIASNADASKSISIQVKTNSDGHAKWILTQKSEHFYSSNHFYVMVALKPLGHRPDFYIVPSQVVADYIANRHAAWLKGKKVGGASRKDSAIRNFIDLDGKYREAWYLLSI